MSGPAPRTTFRWGIAGPGTIATRFVDAMALSTDGTVVAVASRSLVRAEAFAAHHAIDSSYGDYRQLADDPRVDAVYVATPHARHCADTLLFIRAGKHVLCEKPFALTHPQALLMVDAAREEGVFLMEAMWSRFLPSYTALRDTLDAGLIGEPLMVEADFGFRVPVDPSHRLFDPTLGGGALLDLGIYPLQLCSWVLGTPDRLVAEGVIGSTGVDEQVAAVLHHRAGSLGVVKAAIRAATSCRARISGSDGWIELPPFMHCPDHVTVHDSSGTRRINGRFEGDGLRFELDEVHRCLAAGAAESGRMPLNETLALSRTLDQIRQAIGLRYPEGSNP